jgi:hypothetical protein
MIRALEGESFTHHGGRVSPIEPTADSPTFQQLAWVKLSPSPCPLPSQRLGGRGGMAGRLGWIVSPPCS